jgi:hypothetical protein
VITCWPRWVAVDMWLLFHTLHPQLNPWHQAQNPSH